MKIAGYYYITPGKTIEFIRNGPNVLKSLNEAPGAEYFWPIDLDNKTSAINFLIEAQYFGMSYDKFFVLSVKWHITHKDILKYIDLLQLESKIQSDGSVIIKNKNKLGFMARGPNHILTLVKLCSLYFSSSLVSKTDPNSFEALASSHSCG